MDSGLSRLWMACFLLLFYTDVFQSSDDVYKRRNQSKLYISFCEVTKQYDRFELL